MSSGTSTTEGAAASPTTQRASAPGAARLDDKLLTAAELGNGWAAFSQTGSSGSGSTGVGGSTCTRLDTTSGPLGPLPERAVRYFGGPKISPGSFDVLLGEVLKRGSLSAVSTAYDQEVALFDSCVDRQITEPGQTGVLVIQKKPLSASADAITLYVHSTTFAQSTGVAAGETQTDDYVVARKGDVLMLLLFSPDEQSHATLTTIAQKALAQI